MSTHIVSVHGRAVAVTLTLGHDGHWIATHEATGAFGYGRTEADALDDVRDHLERDRAFYCGSGLPMTGLTAAKRTMYERLFDCAGETTDAPYATYVEIGMTEQKP